MKNQNGKPTSQATQRIYLMLCEKTHIEFCVTCFEDLPLHINGNDAFVKDLQNLLKVSSYQSFSKMTRFENNVPWVFQMSYAQGIKVLIIFNDEYTHASTKES